MTHCPRCQQKLTPTHMCLGMLDGMPVGPRVGHRVLLIGEEQKRRAREIVDYAHAHPYRVGETAVPGTMREHCIEVPVGIRCVYSLTVMAGDPLSYKHLSISLADAPDRLVAPEVGFAIAIELFGFHGPPGSWHIGLPEPGARPPGIVVIAQPFHAGEA